jgi:hypothetical protein
VNTIEALSAVSNVATAVGVAVGAYQLLITRRQAVTSFEDSLTAQYREIIANLPLRALFGASLLRRELDSALPHFYRYFDLCNEQAFLYRRGRITRKAWSNWEQGIMSNMNRPAFAAAWTVVASRAQDDFDELRRLCPPADPSVAGAKAV